MSAIIDHGAPIAFATAVWFLSTGLILRLVRGPANSQSRVLIATGSVSLLSIAAFAISLNVSSPLGAYVAFASAVALWGAHEIAFLTGSLTGPRTEDCPPGARGWRRFRLATATLIHHELALAATAIVMGAVSLNAANPLGAMVFGLLWLLRLASKFNIFLGVPNPPAELLPRQLAHLASYFRRGPVGPLLATTLAGAVAAATVFAARAFAAPAGTGEAVGAALLFSLAALGVVEHLFMALPLNDAALWRWATHSKLPILRLSAERKPASAPVPAGGSTK